jgi:quercetin dioxygenase-like cupin family protein
VATPGSAPGATPSDTVSGVLGGPTKAKQDKIELKTQVPATVTTFDLTYPPGGFSGWHSHPGIVIAVVKQGSVIRQTGCTRQTFPVGQSFTEVGPHYVSNASATDPAVLSITRIYPTSATVSRIDEPAPTC